MGPCWLEKLVYGEKTHAGHKCPLLWCKVCSYDRSWILPWIESISNELDITCNVIAPQLSAHCDVISNRLWRHQQNVKQTSKTRAQWVKIVEFIVIYGFAVSCKKENNVCTLVTNYFWAHSSINLVFIAHKQFPTRVVHYSTWLICPCVCFGAWGLVTVLRKIE